MRDRKSGCLGTIVLVAIALILLGTRWLRGPDGSSSTPPPLPAGAAAPDLEVPRTAPQPARASRPREAERPEERHDLSVDEARGGHTLARHVGRTDADLRERLASEGISTASTYTSREIAERTVARALRDNANRVENWSSRRGNRPNLAVDYHGNRDDVLGRCMRRGRDSVDCFDAVVVLRWSGRDFYVLTSYPELSR